MSNDQSTRMTAKAAIAAIRRVILYARVSTDEQAGNYSLPTQLEACRKYAEQNGMVVVAEFSDDYSGATPIEARPEGRKAFAMLKSGEADCLVAFAMDRIARPPEDGDEWDTPLLIRGLARLGKELHTVNRGQLKTDFASLLVAMLDAKGAGEERRKIIERTSRGRNAKARAGKVVGNGRQPYGYAFARETLLNGKTRIAGIEIDPIESSVVLDIFKQYTDDLLTCRQIAVQLTNAGISTPKDANKNHRGVWNSHSVAFILGNKVYAGVWEYGKERVEIPVPALISLEKWEQAQQRKKDNKRRSQRKHYYLLAGRIDCGCGACMSGVRGRNDLAYYRCMAYSRLVCYGAKFAKECKERHVRADVIEPLAWEVALQSKKSIAEFTAMLKDYQEQQKKDTAPLAGQIAEVKAMLEVTSRRIKRLASLVGSATDDDESEQYTADLEAAKKDKASQERKLAKLEAEYDWTDSLTDDDILAVLEMRANDLEKLRGATFEEKRRYLAKIDLRVIVKNRKAKIECKLPVPPRSVNLDSGVVVSGDF